MSEAYSIAAKLTLDTSKFTSEIDKISKKIQFISKEFSSVLGGEFEKATKKIKAASKELNSALDADFKKSAKSISEFSSLLSTEVGKGFKNATKETKLSCGNLKNNVKNDFDGICKSINVGMQRVGIVGSRGFKMIAKEAKIQTNHIKNSLSGGFSNTSKTVIDSSILMGSSVGSNLKHIANTASYQANKIKTSFSNAFFHTENKAKQTSFNVSSNFSSMGKSLAAVAAIGGVTAGAFSIMRKGLERFSIIKDFPKQMGAFGISVQESKAGIDTLKNSIIGLPVSLADTVAQTQQLYSTTRNFDKSTKMVIALNGAFAAAKADAHATEAAFRHFNSALNEGKITQQDMIYISFAMGPALDKVAESFGYAKGKTEIFKKDLIDGKITMEEFSDKLADMDQELAKLGKEAGGGISTSLSNLNNAFASLGAAAWEALEEILLSLTGTDIQGNIERITNTVKTFTNALKAMFPKEEIKEGSDGLKEALPKDDFLVGIGHVIKFATALGALAVGFSIVTKIASLVVGVFKVIGTILAVITTIASSAAAPFIAIGLVIAAVVGIIIWHWDQIKNFFINLWDSICQIFSVVIDIICKEFDDMGIDLRAIASAISEFLFGIWNGICSTAKWLWEGIVNTIVGVWNTLVSKASEIFENIKKTIVDIFNSVSSKVTEIWDRIKNTIFGVWNEIKATIKKVTGFFGGGGTPAAAVAIDENTTYTNEFLYAGKINHKLESLANIGKFDNTANITVNSPATKVYVLLDSKELATKSFSSINDLINAKTLIKTSQINGAW